jgi:hypothetical protein
MSHPVGSVLRDRIEVGFVEADVEIGFTLVDLAEAECGCGNSSSASRVLKDAEDVFHDIEQRLQRLNIQERGCFHSLVSELRREIDLAKSHHSAIE